MKRENPVKGRTVVPYNPLLKYTEADLQQVIKQAHREARRRFMDEIGATELNAATTPSSRSLAAGEERRFMEALDQERGSLCLGNHTDDELAAELFIYGDMSTEDKTRAILSGKPSSIVYLMAGKERIRWLSRHLDASLSSEEKLKARVKELEEQLESMQADLADAQLRAGM